MRTEAYAVTLGGSPLCGWLYASRHSAEMAARELNLNLHDTSPRYKVVKVAIEIVEEVAA